MFPKSLRWRLPLSYAAIALLATFALGLILLLALRDYYLGQEQDYIQSVAFEVSDKMGPLLMTELPPAALVSQAKGYAYLTQTRVRVLGPAGTVLADSAAALEPDFPATVSVQVEIAGVSQVFSQVFAEDSTGVTYRSEIVVEDANSQTRLMLDTQIVQSDGASNSDFPIATPFNWLAGSGPRSEAQTRLAIYVPTNSDPVGFVDISEGPSFGRTIVTRVAWAWAAASLLATLIAAAAGWYISRYLTAPLLHLTDVTRQMMRGDFSVRAALDRPDELGLLASAFNDMAQRVAETVGTLRRFVSDAAHTLQTPLTVLHSDLDLIAANPDSSRQAERIERARSQVDRLAAISGGLLALSKIEGTNERLQTVSLSNLVSTCSELAASRAEQAGLTFSLAVPDDAATIAGEESELRQVVENILDNAVKFNRAGGSIDVTLTSASDGTVFTVADSGIGIPKADLPAMFGRFHRAGNAGDYAGSGLGLAIVKAVVTKHGGTVSIESDGEGTVVTVQLPPVSLKPRDNRRQNR